jgi:hypothetical protein
MKKTVLLVPLVILFFFSGVAKAIPIQWSSAVGGNDHWYEAVRAPEMSWTDALINASAMGGHLATITSLAENQFIFNELGIGTLPYWLGGSDFNEEGIWEWVTGEAWLYENWTPGEPNNLFNEDALVFSFFIGDGGWNDAPINHTGYGQGGFVVEYSYISAPTTFVLLGIGLLVFAAVRKIR